MRGPDQHHTAVDPATGERVHTTTAAAGVDHKVLEDVRKDAYQRGVADERARHKRNPILSILIALAAVLGLAVIALAIWRGSFSEAGRTLDQGTREAAEQARTAGREVADESGEALQDAGRGLESRGEAGQAAPSGAQPAPAGQTPPPAQ